MKKLLLGLLLLFAFYRYLIYVPHTTPVSNNNVVISPIRTVETPPVKELQKQIKRTTPSKSSIDKAVQNRRSHIQVEGSGRVIKVLRDDVKGSRHQKFLLRIASGTTILIAHNIDLAPRIQGLRKGDVVKFYGEYAWNSKGGVVHWTHKDPRGRHKSGWLKHQGRVYQ